jgi:TrmH family RNA methyltransferase
VEGEVLESLSEAQNAPDVIAVAKMPAPRDLQLDSLTLVLDEIGDPGNVGTLIRTADAVGASEIVLTSGSADAWSPKVVRSSAGSVFHLPPQSSTRIELISLLKSQNVPIVAAVAHQGEDCFRFRWPSRCALVLGHETRGISPELEEAADSRVTIPMFGKAESLNVASAGAVLLYAWRQRSD